MTVRQIASTAAALLQADDMEAILESGDNTAALDDADVKTLIKCVNLAAAELCADGFPLCYTQELAAENGIIGFGDFTALPSTVRAVVKNGAPARFAIDTRGIKVHGDGVYAVTYSAVPSDKNVDDEVEVGALCDGNIVAYLAARNFCLITGRTDEASVWDQRYTAEAEKRRLTRRATVAGRRWR